MVIKYNFDTILRGSSGSIPVSITREWKHGENPEDGWTETHVIYGDVRGLTSEGVLNQVARGEKRAGWCGDSFVWAARIVESNEDRTVVEQQGSGAV